MNFNKFQNETGKIIKKEIDEMKKKAQDKKEELNKDMENLRKKKQAEILKIKSSLNQIKNTVERRSSRLKVEDRISAWKDKVDVFSF
jgi:acetyl-CoA carboxylase alpha subunit